MKSMYKPNISATGRFVSTVAGAALATIGYRKRNRVMSALGLGLVGRGASGWCPVTAAVGRNGRRAEQDDTQRHLSGSGGVLVEDAITIYRPVDEVYKYWRNLENLPQFMQHLDDVRMIDSTRSRWVAIGPLGVRVAWDAEIINDIPPTLISWKSVGDADVVSAGSVRFKSIGEQATEIYVRLQYDPPAGKVGATVAWLLGEDPQHQIGDDLRRFKQVLEQGELMAGYRTTPTSQRMRRGLDDPDLATDFGSIR